MRWLAELWSRLAHSARSKAAEQRVDEEMAFHLDHLVDKLRARGLSDSEARRQAALTFGGREPARQAARDQSRAAGLEDAWRDLRFALRTLRRSVGFTSSVLLTLALGIGTTTAMFSLVNGILLRPLPYADSEQLVAVKHRAAGLGPDEIGLSSGTYFHYTRYATSFEGLAVYTERVSTFGGDGRGTERVNAVWAGAELFTVLRATPGLGRLFTQEDARPGFMNTRWTIPIILSHDYWRSRFGSSEDVIGRLVTMNEAERVVVGVMPEGFAFPRADVQVWVLHQPPPESANFARSFDLKGVARLKSGVSADAAAAELAGVLPRIEGQYADATPERIQDLRLSPVVLPLREEVVRSAETLLWALFGGMSFLLLAACANVATLFLARAETRTRELAIRRALGAGPAAMARAAIAEAVVVAAVGALMGGLLAYAAVSSLNWWAPVDLPRLDEVHVDWVSFVFATVLAAGGAVAFGGLALRHGLTTSAASRLVQGHRTATASPRQRRLRNVLVVAQLAVAVALVSGSALMAQSLWRITHVPLGFEPASMLTAEVGLPGRRAGQHQAIYQQLVDRLRILPGVLSVSAGSFAPLAGAEHVFPVVVDDEPRPGVIEPVLVKFVMPDYFRTMGMRLTGGVSLEEVGGTPAPVWLSATLAERLFQGGSAVGRHVRRLEANGDPVSMFDRGTASFQPVPPFTVAGVVNEVVEESSRLGPSSVLYVPVRSPVVERKIVPTTMMLLVRTSGSPMDTAASVRSIVHEVDRSLSVARIRPMVDIVNASTGTERFLVILLSFGAVVSLFLGLVGVYGVAAESVKRRTQEIGIRIALGAQRRQVEGLVMREATTIALIGLALGLTTTLAAAQGLRSFLFAVSPTDAMTLGVATAVLATAAVVAIYWPARRAAHLEPVKALRGE